MFGFKKNYRDRYIESLEDQNEYLKHMMDQLLKARGLKPIHDRDTDPVIENIDDAFAGVREPEGEVVGGDT